MIYEYALDPALVARWCERAEWSFYDGKFGIGCHRVACVLPEKTWRDRVLKAWEATQEKLADEAARQAARRQLEARVQRLMGGGSTRRAGLVEEARAWIEHATHEHGRRVFQGVLTDDGASRGKLPVLAGRRLNETERGGWGPERRVHTRTPVGIAGALGPLLRCAREVRLVDPYFDPSAAGFARTLDAIVRGAYDRREAAETPRVQVHTALDLTARRDGERKVFEDWRRRRDAEGAPKSEGEAERVLGAWLRRGFESLRGRWPGGASVEVFLWRRGRESMHNRYVLTELGGVLMGAGFDEPSGARDATDDAALLSREQYEHRWGLYGTGSTGLGSVGRFMIGA